MSEEVQDLNSDEVVEELYQQATAPNENTIPMEKEAPAPEKTWKFNASGKEVEATEEQLIKWAQQGHGAVQEQQRINELQQQIEQREQAAKELESKYGNVDKFIQENPDWWEHVQKSYEQKENPTANMDNEDNPMLNAMKELSEQVRELSQFKQELTAKQREEERNQEDQALSSEIKSIQEAYPNLDFKEVQKSGRTLEADLLNHAMELGVSNAKGFKAAFRDYMHERLVSDAELRGKESAQSEIQRRNKLGLLGQTPTPLKTIQPAQSVKDKSYEDLAREALAELESGAYN